MAMTLWDGMGGGNQRYHSSRLVCVMCVMECAVGRWRGERRIFLFWRAGRTKYKK